MARTMISFPVIVWHIYFCFLLILLVTFDVISEVSLGFITMVLKYSSVLAFGFLTIDLAFIMHPRFLSLEFVSNIYAFVMSMVGLEFRSTFLKGS